MVLYQIALWVLEQSNQIRFRFSNLCRLFHLSNFVKFDLRGNSPFTKEFFFQKDCLKADKQLLLISQVEIIPFALFWVSYKIILIRPRS